MAPVETTRSRGGVQAVRFPRVAFFANRWVVMPSSEVAVVRECISVSRRSIGVRNLLEDALVQRNQSNTFIQLSIQGDLSIHSSGACRKVGPFPVIELGVR